MALLWAPLEAWAQAPRPSSFGHEDEASEESLDGRRRVEPGSADEEAGGGNGRGGDRSPLWRPFAAASAFAGLERTQQRQLDTLDDGTRVSQTSEESAATLGVGGEVGAARRGERTNFHGAYVVALAVRNDEVVGLQSVTQGLNAQVDHRASEQTGLYARTSTFWGVRDSQAAVAGSGVGDASGADESSSPAEGADARRISRIPYFRQDAALGVAHSPTTTVRGQAGVSARAQFYPDQDVLRASGERVFEVYSAGPQLDVLWGPTERDGIQASAAAETTWFVPVGASDTETRTVTSDPPPLESITARLGWTRGLTLSWVAEASVGAGIAFPLESTDQTTGAGATLTGGLGTTYTQGTWSLGVNLERGLLQSDVGAVFATTSLRAAARRELGRPVEVTAGAGLVRYDVLTQVFASDADLEAFAAASPEDELSRGALETRARRAQEGYGLEGSVTVLWQIFGFAGLSMSYSYEQRVSDDRDRGDRRVHRGLVGLTLTSTAAMGGTSDRSGVD